MLKAVLTAVTLFFSITLTRAEAGPDTGPPAADQTLAFTSPSEHPQPRMLVVPAQTEAQIQLLSGIHSQVSHEGDQVTAQLLQPIYVDGQVALPAGSLIAGHIARIRPAGRMRRPAELVLRFERITLPDGQDQPLSAMLTELDALPRSNTCVDSEGLLKGTKTVAWKRIAGGLVGLGALGALQGQVAGAAALGATLPIGGGAVLGYSFLWPKGNDVHVPPDTPMRIRLRNALTVRVAW